MTNSMRNVLVIAYYFPPMGLSGVQRTAKFVKYLPKYGWKPTVLTVGKTGYYAIDESLLTEVERAGANIVRASSLDANRLFKKQSVVKMPSERMRKFLQFCGDSVFFPDTKIGWKSSALKAASDLLQREPFDLIFATAPPQTDFLIARELKRRFKIPVVLDYRDAWLEYPFKYYPTPVHRYIHYRMEKSVLKAADKVVVTLRSVKESILKHYLALDFQDVVIIPQGYDPEDLDTGRVSHPPRRNKLRIAHAGTFYAERTPTVLLHALHNIFQASPTLRGRIELTLIGNIRAEDQLLVNKLGLQNVVNFTGYLEHRECIGKLLESDLLWFVLDNPYQSPGKLYEYIGTRKPILASVVEGHVRQLILESGAGVCLPLNDVGAHEQALLDIFARYERNDLKPIPAEFARRYNRIQLTGELAKQFEALMDIDKNAFVRREEGVA